MAPARIDRLYWASWVVAAALTGLVAGFMLGHALILAPFIDWLLSSSAAGLFAQTYPVFRSGAGRIGLDVFYMLAGLQVLATLAFLVLAWILQRHRLAAAVAGAGGAGWVVLHYVSGFGALEAVVVRTATDVPAEVARRFLAWNTPIHYVHAAALTVSLGALLAVPLSARRQKD